jgi:hypothetical protein
MTAKKSMKTVKPVAPALKIVKPPVEKKVAPVHYGRTNNFNHNQTVLRT